MTAAVIPIRRAAPDAYLDESFGPEGHLAKASPNYEPRAGQVQLARAVDAAIRQGKPAMLEGPCGTGKSFAYLIPGTHHAAGGGKRRAQTKRAEQLMVSTGTIALQEQLVTVDLPRLQKTLPWPFTFALVKGRSNFVCNEAVPAATPPFDATREERRQLDAIQQWARQTTTGDKSELPFVPVERLWKRVTVDSDDCKGKDCPRREACFYERAKAAAADADVLVVNHHLLCADLAIRAQLPGVAILPTPRVLVLDEAHELPDTARDFFGATLTRSLVDRACRYAERFLGDERARELRGAGDAYFDALQTHALAHERRELGSKRQSRYAVRAPLDDGRAIEASAFTAAIVHLARFAAQEEKALDQKEKGEALDADESDARAKHRTAARRFKKVADWLRALHGDPELDPADFEPDPNIAAWAELSPPNDRGDRYLVLEARQVDVTAPLAALAERVGAVVLTSATLTVGGTFEFLKSETGIAPATELEVASPFDFAARCLAVVPDKMPLPDSPLWPAACAQVVAKMVEAADGRTLALFSSRKNLDAVYELVATDPGRTWLKQGELPPRELAHLFKSDPRAVLFGLRSFWTGIDVPGDALLAVFIDRVPFPQRDEPVIRRLRLKHGDAAFEHVDLPRALMQVRQGFGRLIRHREDYGVVVFGDRRVLTKGWGRKLFASLPRTQRGARSADVASFLRRFGGGR